MAPSMTSSTAKRRGVSHSWHVVDGQFGFSAFCQGRTEGVPSTTLATPLQQVGITQVE